MTHSDNAIKAAEKAGLAWLKAAVAMTNARSELKAYGEKQ